eukprot:1192903-Rhodomonas_salina.2
MSGTDLVREISGTDLATPLPGTDERYHQHEPAKGRIAPTVQRACYAMSGTDKRYAATRAACSLAYEGRKASG